MALNSFLEDMTVLPVNALIKASRHSVAVSLMLVMLLAACVRPATQTPPPASRLERITQAGVLQVGVAADVPPFAFIDRQGEQQGFDIALMTEIARQMELEAAWTDAAYDRLPELVQSGKVDMAIGAIPCSAEWEQQVDFSQPYHQPVQTAPPGRGMLCILLPKGEQALAERLNAIIDELVNEGFIQRLEGEYLAP